MIDTDRYRFNQLAVKELLVVDLLKAAVIGAILFVFFEASVVNALRGAPLAYLMVSQISDALIFLAAGGILLLRMLDGSNVRMPGLLLVPLVLGILVFTVAIATDGSVATVLLNYKALIRFFILSWVIANLCLRDWLDLDRQYRLAMILLLVTSLQVCVAALQKIYGGGLLEFFVYQPFSYGAIEMNQQTLKAGAAVGTLGRPVALALFGLVIGTMSVAFLLRGRGTRLLWVCLYLMCLLLTIMSMKRVNILLLTLMPFVAYAIYGRYRVYLNVMSVFIVGFGLSIAFLFWQHESLSGQPLGNAKEVEVTPVEAVLELGTRDYWDHTMSVSRGWVLKEVAPAAIKYTPVFGFSMDPVVAQQSLAQAASLPRLHRYGPLKDVYWVSLWIFVGPVGMALVVFWFAILGRQIWIAQAGQWHSPWAVAAVLLIFAMVPLLFIERAVEVRSFSLIAFTIFGLATYCVRSRNVRGREC